MTAMAADAESFMTTQMESLDVSDLVRLCRACVALATPISAWKMKLALKVLACRLDQRSFVNVCEDIARGEA